MPENEISVLKKRLRREALRRRRELSAGAVREKSSRIMGSIFSMNEWAEASLILFYVDSKDNEVETRGAIERAIREGRRVACPITNLATKTLVFSEIHGLDELVPGCFGLLEPREKQAKPVEVADASLVIVPGIAYDGQCNRLGYGGGFYDRVLAEASAPSVAPAYDYQIVDEVPMGEYDQLVDRIVTETRVIERKR